VRDSAKKIAIAGSIALTGAVGAVLLHEGGAERRAAPRERRAPAAPAPKLSVAFATSRAPASLVGARPAPTRGAAPVGPFSSVATPTSAALAGGYAAIVAALRDGDDATADAVVRALLADPRALSGHDLQLALALLAKDRAARRERAALAIDLLGRNHSPDATTVQELSALALGGVADPALRARAAVALGIAAAAHGELLAAATPKLLAYLSTGPDNVARADTLAVLRLDGASTPQIRQVIPSLADADPLVRTGAARALATVPGANHGLVAPPLERALAAEQDPRARDAIGRALAARQK
jgi:hypothetical protein